MSVDAKSLKEKLHEIYPEIVTHQLKLTVNFDKGKDAWVVSFEKGSHRRHAFLDKKDADSCIGGNVCVYLGMLIAQYIKDMELLVSKSIPVQGKF